MIIDQYIADMGNRHLGLISATEQHALREAVICGAGAGGAGGWSYIALARMGCRIFRIADCGVFDASNANRQAGCNSETIGRNKADVLREQLLLVNPEADILVFEEGITAANVDTFLQGGTVVLDGIDLYELEIKKKLYDAAHSKQIPIFSSPVLGFGTALAVFDPAKSPTFEEYFGTIPDSSDRAAWQSYIKEIGAGFFGFKPKLDWSLYMQRVYEGEVPSVGVACMASGAMTATAIMDWICGQRSFPAVPTTLHFDLRQQKWVKVGPWKRKIFKLLMQAYLRSRGR